MAARLPHIPGLNYSKNAAETEREADETIQDGSTPREDQLPEATTATEDKPPESSPNPESESFSEPAEHKPATENADQEQPETTKSDTDTEQHNNGQKPTSKASSANRSPIFPSVKVGPEKSSSSQIPPFKSQLDAVASNFRQPSYRVNADIRKSIFKTATKERSESRFTWVTNFDFWLVSVACVVGITNFLTFPQMCQKYGGLAFFIPYLIVVVFMGLPLYFLETILGQYSGHGTVAVMNELVPGFVGIGYALVINNFVSFMRNEIDIAKVTYLFSVSLQEVIPWSVCQRENSIGCYTIADDMYCKNKIGNDSAFFNLTCTRLRRICEYANATVSPDGSNTCLLANGSSAHLSELVQRTTPEEEFHYRRILNLEGASLSQLGPIQWPMFFSLAACWVMTYTMGHNGFCTTAKSAYFTVFGPLAGFIILFLKVFTQDGAWKGIQTYLTFEPSSLMYKDVWLDAVSTCVTSLSIGLGLMTAIASANKPYKNCLKTSISVICADMISSLLSGLVIFALVGHMAFRYNTTVEQLLHIDRDVTFTTIPGALALLHFPRVYIVICYASMALMSFGYLAAVIAMTTYDGKDIFNAIFNRAGSDEEKSASGISIYQHNIITCLLGFSFSLLYVVRGGTLVLGITDTKKHINAPLMIEALQPLAVCLFYGSGRVLDLVEHELGIRLGRSRPYWAFAWNVSAPGLLLWAAFSVVPEPSNAPAGWELFATCFAFYPFLIVFGFLVLQMYWYRHDGLAAVVKPTRRWCMGLDATLLIHATDMDPEIWKERLDPTPQDTAPLVSIQIDMLNTENGQKNEPAISTEASTLQLPGSRLTRAKSIFKGPKAQAILDHTLRDNSYVPFGKQLLEGQKIRHSIAMTSQQDRGGLRYSRHVSRPLVLTSSSHRHPDDEETRERAGSVVPLPPI